MASLVGFLLIVWLLGVAALLLRWRRLLLGLWREPVLRRPVLIIESDDWGAGPPEQAQALTRLAARLSEYRDRDGRHPVMTLGLVLATADTHAMQANDLSAYQHLTLADARYEALRQAIVDGAAARVFAIQLHGMEHYWPPALMQAAEYDVFVRQWLAGDAYPRTERLPSHLQSRWISAAMLPSTPLPDAQIAAAVAAEARCYYDLFPQADSVVVPPTFVWDRRVEQAWAEHGMDVIVTPGRRHEGRNSAGRITPAVARLFNGQRNAEGQIYLVRDVYFEPAQGHTAEHTLAAVSARVAAGRPALLETHRFNFIDEKGEASLAELTRLLDGALQAYPQLAFISTAELARIYRDRDTHWLTVAYPDRLQAFIQRCRREYALWRHFKFSGLALLLTGLGRLLRLRPSTQSGGL